MASPFATGPLTGPLPPGRHRIAREHVLSSQRGRLLDACAATVAEHGYATATIGQIVRRAQVSRRTFYEHFSGKEECFLATYDAGAEILDRVTAEAVEAHQRWRNQISAAIAAYLDLLAREPAFTRTMVLESLAAGPTALERRRALQQATAQGFRAVREAEPDAPVLDDVTYRAVVGGISEVVADHVAAARYDDLPALRAPLTGFVLSNLERR